MTVQSIDLTRLPSSHASGVTSPNNAADSPAFRYSSREMCPPHLLIQQLRRGYSTFLLHHDFTLDDLYRRVDRSAFSTLLDRFWMKFAWTWDVLLSGNPAVDIYNGIKLSVGGEIGVGVGEEEWGSGERAVLEDFTARSEGLVDLIVSRFGDPPAPVEDTGSPKTSAPPTNENDEAQWLGCEDCARPSDGVVFSGVGAISRGSLLQVSQWMEWIYRYGDDAYGVCDDPTSTRPRRQRKKRTKMAAKDANNLSAMTTSRHSAQEHSFSPGIPKPLVMGGSQPFQSADKPRNSPRGERSPEWNARSNDWSGLNSESFMKVLTLGYGSSWSFPSLMLNTQPDASGPKQEDSTGETRQSCHGNGDAEDMSTADGPKRPSAGRFIIGLREDLHNSDERSPDKSMTSNSRILHRKLHIRMAAPEPTDKKLQVIIYVVSLRPSSLQVTTNQQQLTSTRINHSCTPSFSTPKLHPSQIPPSTPTSSISLTPCTNLSRPQPPLQPQQPESQCPRPLSTPATASPKTEISLSTN